MSEMNIKESQEPNNDLILIERPFPSRKRKRNKLYNFEIHIRKKFSVYLILIGIFQFIVYNYFTFFSFLPIGLTKEPYQHPMIWFQLFSFIVGLFIFVVSIRIQWLIGSKGIVAFYISAMLMIALLIAQFIDVFRFFINMKVFNVLFSNIEYLYTTAMIFIVVTMLYIKIYQSIRNISYSELTTRIVIVQCFNIITLSWVIIFMFSFIEWNMQDIIVGGVLKYSNGDKVENFFDFVYFNTITYFTVGYGDIVPVSGFSKFLSIVESIISYLNALILITLIILNKKDILHESTEHKLDKYLIKIFVLLQILWIFFLIIEYLPFVRLPSWSQGYSSGGIKFR